MSTAQPVALFMVEWALTPDQEWAAGPFGGMRY